MSCSCTTPPVYCLTHALQCVHASFTCAGLVCLMLLCLPACAALGTCFSQPACLSIVTSAADAPIACSCLTSYHVAIMCCHILSHPIMWPMLSHPIMCSFIMWPLQGEIMHGDPVTVIELFVDCCFMVDISFNFRCEQDTVKCLSPFVWHFGCKDV